jgi:RNA polymerase sigma factor for flagellar operon FliA
MLMSSAPGSSAGPSEGSSARRTVPHRVQAYQQGAKIRSPQEREAEIVRHLPLVQTIVDRIAATLPPSVDRDDLVSAGVIGLMDAIERFDASRDNAFSTYAVMRIRGAVIDELRERDWVPRSARERARDYQRTVNELAGQLGRSPSDGELAKALGVSEDALPELERSAHLSTQVSLDEPIGDDASLGSVLASHDGDTDNPARYLEREDLRRVLVKALGTLTEQERIVIKLYYFEELLLREIAEILGVTESRVCQIHGRLMQVLRSRVAADS